MSKSKQELKTRVTTNPSISRTKDGTTKKILEKKSSITVKDEKAKKITKETIEKSDKHSMRSKPLTHSNVKDVKKPKVSSEKPKVTSEKSLKLKTVSHKSLSIEKKPTNPKANVRAAAAPAAAAPKTTSNRKAPLRATHSIDVKSSVKPLNVMNQVHNVTVSSPPPIRRELNESQSMETENVKSTVESSTTRDRTRTRTLGESEIILLKPTNSEKKTKETFESMPAQSVNVEIRPPISFEVNFEEEMKGKETKEKKMNDKFEQYKDDNINDQHNKTFIATNEKTNIERKENEEERDEEEPDQYEDDFESYESDFEVDLSSNESVDNNSDENTKSEEESTYNDDSSSRGGSSRSSNNSNIVKSATKHPFKIQSNSLSGEYDSGSFEMKPLQSKGHIDDNCPIIINEHQKEIQNDSGFDNNSQTLNPSALTMNSLEINNKTCDNISDIEIEMNGNAIKMEKFMKINNRGKELLEKIVLDTMNFLLLDSKPISYDLYMKIYGNNSSLQISTQTHYDRIDVECECDAIQMTDSWTQMPQTFYKNEMFLPNFNSYRIGSETKPYFDQTESYLNDSWQLLQKFMLPTEIKPFEENDSIDFDALNRFLLAKEITVTDLLLNDRNHTKWKDSRLTNSEKYLEISLDSMQLLKTFKLYDMFASNALPGFLFSFHYDSNRLMHLIVMWSLSNPDRPFCILSSWTKVTCIEIHENIRNAIFGGLSDGSIAVWDYTEAKYWQPPFESSQKRYIPSEVVAPNVQDIENGTRDFGKIVSLRSLYSKIDVELLDGYNTREILSLHEYGFLALWTILDSTTNQSIDANTKQIDHQSTWSTIKLVQCKIIDLRSCIQSMYRQQTTRITSASFEKTRSYFENDLFTDAALKELQTINDNETRQLSNVYCLALEVNDGGIFIASSENFIIYGRRTFKLNIFKKIQIDDRKNVHVQQFLTMNHLKCDELFVQLSDGTIKAFSHPSVIHQINSNTEYGIDLSISPLTFVPVNTPSKPTSATSNERISSATPNNLQTNSGAFSIGQELGKSCIIQNIVQNERKIYNEAQTFGIFDSNELKFLNDSNNERILMNNLLPDIVNNQLICFKPKQCKTYEQIISLIKSHRLIILKENQLNMFHLINDKLISLDFLNDEMKCNLQRIRSCIDDKGIEYLIIYDDKNRIQIHAI